MSLRDQFLKAGLVSKTQADSAQRELRKQEKIAQGQALARREQERLDAEERALQVAAREAEHAARRRAAREREEAHMRVVRCQQILRAHALRFRPGTQRFHFRSPDGRHAWRLWLPERLATDLRVCRLALAWVDDLRPEVVVIDPATADRIEALRPELVLFRNRPPIDLDVSQQLYED